MKRSRWWLWRGGKYPPTRIEVEPVTKHMKREKEMGELSVFKKVTHHVSKAMSGKEERTK
jgi:hypothetical protein